jgi:hypothetical protein
LSEIAPAFAIEAPFTVRREPSSILSVLYEPTVRFAIDGEMSSAVTAGVPEMPFVRQTLVVELFGTPFGDQLPPPLQAPESTFQEEHCPKAGAEDTHANAKTIRAARTQPNRLMRAFVLKHTKFIKLFPPKDTLFSLRFLPGWLRIYETD